MLRSMSETETTSSEQRAVYLRDRIQSIEFQLYGCMGENTDFLTVSESADSSRTISRDDAVRLLQRLKMELATLENGGDTWGVFGKPARFKPMFGW
jgi:hypothetical protein